MAEFTEVAHRCWMARYPWLDVNVGLIEGSRGLVVIDTNASSELAGTVLDDVRRISAAPLLAAVNTHHHFDHCFGNLVLAGAGAELICHDVAATLMEPRGRDVQAEARHSGLAATEIRVPTRTFSSALTLDLGDRAVELIHPGRGHTGGDLVARVGDADVMFAGDLVEESALRGAVPGYGDDCYPMDWPTSLDLILQLITLDTVVVPGHGAPVDRSFVQEQRSEIGIVAETIRDLAGRGVPVGQALEQGEWPWPAEQMADAVQRGYEQLPRSQKRLPLI